MLITLLFLLFGVTFVTRIGSRIRKAFSELEAIPTAPSTPQQSAAGMEEEVQEENYFTYESVKSDEEFYTAAATSAPKRTPVAVAEVESFSSDRWNNGFDLRQAVIYQTILHNPFWGESRQ